MRILVTGGSGRVGQFTIANLLQHDHDVVNADRVRPTNPRAPKEAREAKFIETDLSSVGEVAGALAGCDGVIHLGAIPAPYSHADERVFTNNVTATFAVLQAASLLGIKRAVTASSISAYGTAYAPVPFPPPIAPVVETDPLLNHDAYGLSKEVDERTAEMFHRRTGMQIAALRFHWVSLPEEETERAKVISADPRVDDIWRLFWGYVDIEDAANACRLAIEAEGIGFNAFNITAADTLSGTPTEELMRTITPDVQIRKAIPGCGTAFSIEKARKMLGYVPEKSWRS